MQQDGSNTRFTQSETFRSMPQAVMDRLMSRHTNLKSGKMTEENIDSIILKAATETFDLDLSGSQLTGEAPYFVLDSLSRNEFVNFVHINLSSSNITSNGFSVLMDYFVHFNSLETLKVSNNNLPKEAGVAIAKLLGAHSPLRLLDASDNCLHDAGIAAIAGAFTTDLSRVSDPSLGELSERLNSRQVSFLTLAELDLSGNNFGDGGLLALCRGLTHFLKSMLTRSGVDSACVARNVVCLKILRLNRNKCGEKAASCLAQFLESFYRPGYIPLEELSMGRNPIGVQGIIAILRAIQTQSHIHSASTISTLATSATPYPSLVTLSLEHCGGCSLDVLEEVTQVFVGQNVQNLDLTMSDDDAQHLCSLSMFVDTVVSLADAVTRSSRPVTCLQFGNLVDITKREAASMLPGSTAFYALRVALDSFRSIAESIRMGKCKMIYQQRNNSPSNVSIASHTNSVTALQLQQEDFEQLRREHANAFHQLSDEISRISDVEMQTSLQSALDVINSSGNSAVPGSDSSLHRENHGNYPPHTNLSAVFSPISDHDFASSNCKTDEESRRRENQSNVRSALVFSQADMSNLIESAVTSSLEIARQQWEKGGRDVGNMRKNSDDSSLQDQLEKVVSRVKVLQEQMQALDSQALAAAATNQNEDLARLAIQLETRIARLESRLDHIELGITRNHADSQASLAENKEVLSRRFEHLMSRMSALENSVEAEHETSLDLLDVLLMKKGKTLPSSGTSHSSSTGGGLSNGRRINNSPLDHSSGSGSKKDYVRRN